ncbi:MAG: hypothetical protein ACR2QB_07870 [Gammaproteobacteria bacterium]
MMQALRGRQANHRAPRKILALLPTIVLASCSSIGPDKLVSTHQGYNEAVQLAESREILLNVVRLRFGEPIQFLDVSQINASFSVSAGASGNVSNIGGAGGSVGSAGGNVGYSDNPTITFDPSGDDQFGRDVLSPVHLYDGISFTNRGGSYDSAMFALITSGINEAPDLPGPNGELYRSRLNAMRTLITEDHAWITHGKKWVPRSAHPVPSENVTAFDHTWAVNNGFLWFDAEPFLGEAGHGKLLMGIEYHTPLLVLRDPNDPEALKHVQTLNLAPGDREYIIRSSNDEIALGVNLQKFIYLGFRSLKEIMGIVSEYVDVPPELEERRVVPQARYKLTGADDLQFKVSSGKSEPQGTPNKVYANGYWFWIDPTDQRSKAVLEALYYLYQSQKGSTSKGDPILTLPISPP